MLLQPQDLLPHVLFCLRDTFRLAKIAPIIPVRVKRLDLFAGAHEPQVRLDDRKGAIFRHQFQKSWRNNMDSRESQLIAFLTSSNTIESQNPHPFDATQVRAC